MSGRIATMMLGLLLVAATVIVLLPGTNYFAQDRDATRANSTLKHWSGTDALGAIELRVLLRLFYSGFRAR